MPDFDGWLARLARRGAGSMRRYAVSNTETVGAGARFCETSSPARCWPGCLKVKRGARQSASCKSRSRRYFTAPGRSRPKGRHAASRFHYRDEVVGAEPLQREEKQRVMRPEIDARGSIVGRKADVTPGRVWPGAGWGGSRRFEDSNAAPTIMDLHWSSAVGFWMKVWLRRHRPCFAAACRRTAAFRLWSWLGKK